MRKLVRQTVAEHARFYRAVKLPVQACFVNVFARSSSVIHNSVSPDRSGTDCPSVVLAMFLRLVLLRFATQSLRIAVELIVLESLCRRSCA